MAYTTDRTWVSGEVATASNLNTHLRDNMKWLSTDKPGARVYRSTNQTGIVSGAPTAITFDSERRDTGGVHSTVTNTSRLTVPSGADGMWLVGFTASYAALNATGYRAFTINVNSTGIFRVRDLAPSASLPSDLGGSTAYVATAGDYFELIATHTAGTNATVSASGNTSPEFWAVWLGF